MSTLVAINVLKDNTEILNRDGVPIMFYWNIKEGIIEDLRNNLQFTEWLAGKNIFTDEKLYTATSIAYFYFADKDNNPNGNEDYSSEVVKIQDIYSVQWLLDNGYDTILNHSAIWMHDKVFGRKSDTNVDSIDITADVYKKVKDKYKDKISNETYLKAIRSYYQKECPNMSASNLTVIMNLVQEKINSAE